MKVISLGEVMGRLQANNFLQLQQALPGSIEMTFGGAEFNVAASLAIMGRSVSFVSALPDNTLGDICLRFMKSCGIDCSELIRSSRGRLGLYFVEKGANQRPSKVTYDRSNSAFSLSAAQQYNWEAILSAKDWLHITGISPALSASSAELTNTALQKAKDYGLRVSMDLNFRKKLWQWQPGSAPRELARQTVQPMLEYVDLLIANEEDAADILDIHAGASNAENGKLDISKFPAVAQEICRQYPNIKEVAISLRESISASHNNWGALLYQKLSKKTHFAPLRNGNYAPYQIRNIIDRVGGGDSFAAALIFALTDKELSSPGTAIEYAVAASCLAHSIEGDINFSTRSEIEALMKGNGSGRVQR